MGALLQASVNQYKHTESYCVVNNSPLFEKYTYLALHMHDIVLSTETRSKAPYLFTKVLTSNQRTKVLITTNLIMLKYRKLGIVGALR